MCRRDTQDPTFGVCEIQESFKIVPSDFKYETSHVLAHPDKKCATQAYNQAC
jgi:hypothetical protein